VSNSLIVNIGGKEYNVERSTLRQWLQLEDVVNKIKEGESIAKDIYSYLSIALGEEIDFSKIPWYVPAEAFADILRINNVKYDFPILRIKTKDIEYPWDYEGRSFYIWAHLFADNYGWDIKYISKLDVDDAVALVQEISIEEQLHKEWEWSLSERSIKYDKRGRGKFQPLKRPDWMQLPSQELLKKTEKMKIPIAMIPAGVVVKMNRDETPKP
jgi:hypothetical protein